MSKHSTPSTEAEHEELYDWVRDIKAKAAAYEHLAASVNEVLAHLHEFEPVPYPALSLSKAMREAHERYQEVLAATAEGPHTAEDKDSDG